MNENKNKKRTFKELWQNRQTHAIIVLGMWFAFFVSIFLFLGIASLFSSPQKKVTTNETEETKQVSANIPKMLENLIDSTYNFEITIVDDNSKYSYTGSKENEEIKGYYESSSGIIKYTIKDNIYYQIDGDNLIENENLISEEDKNIIDLNKILELIINYEINNDVIEENNNYIYDILENNIKFNITTNNSNIEKIIIEFNNKNYELIFKNINES